MKPIGDINNARLILLIITEIASKEKAQNKSEEQKLSAKALSNLSELDLTLTTTSTYFKPEAEKMYVIKINPEEKVEIVKNPKFADKDGNIPTRFEFKIYHVNNGAEQLFTTSKTLCKQIVRVTKRLYCI